MPSVRCTARFCKRKFHHLEWHHQSDNSECELQVTNTTHTSGVSSRMIVCDGIAPKQLSQKYVILQNLDSLASLVSLVSLASEKVRA